MSSEELTPEKIRGNNTGGYSKPVLSNPWGIPHNTSKDHLALKLEKMSPLNVVIVLSKMSKTMTTKGQGFPSNYIPEKESRTQK